MGSGLVVKDKQQTWDDRHTQKVTYGKFYGEFYGTFDVSLYGAILKILILFIFVFHTPYLKGPRGLTSLPQKSSSNIFVSQKPL